MSDAAPGPRWPSGAPELLLRALLAEDAAAADGHFRLWLAKADLDAGLDEGSFALLPMLWANLSRLGIEDPLMPRMKGIVRNSWVRSARRAAAAGELLEALAGADVRTMVIKGLPLSLAYYDSPSLRPMIDFDVAVPSDRAEQASRIFAGLGYVPARCDWAVDRAIRHALVHRHPDKGEADLHWHILFDSPGRETDAWFWDAAEPMLVAGTPTLRPCATDLLVHAIVHGLRWNGTMALQWIPDCAAILRSGARIDWARLAAFAHRHRLSRRMFTGLGCLKGFGLPIPDHALAALAGRESMIETIEFFAMRGADERSFWRHIRRGTALVRLLESEDARQLPVAVAREIARRTRPASRASLTHATPEATR
jgi:hypothetical protein